MLDKIAPYAKAIAAFVGPAIPLLLAAMQDGSLGGSAITSQEWLTAAAACFVTSGVVYAAPRNADPGLDAA